MKKLQLGESDIRITRIGFGTWGMAGSGWRDSWGPQDDNDSIKAIQRAWELGINWIDTAPVYGLGHSEEVVGRAIAEMSERPLIFTKCGLVWTDTGDIPCNLQTESVRKECEDSLRRLGVESIDLYQIHWPLDEEHIEEAWQTMVDLKAEGKVRHLGVSNFSIEQLEMISVIEKPVSVQPPYNMLDQGMAKNGLLDYCAQRRIGTICYAPIRQGLLTGKFSPDYLKSLAPDDIRRRIRDFQEPVYSLILELVDHLRPIAEANDMQLIHVALAWVLKHRGATAAILGIRRPDQIENAVTMDDWELSDEDYEEINRLVESYEARRLELE